MYSGSKVLFEKSGKQSGKKSGKQSGKKSGQKSGKQGVKKVKTIASARATR